MCEVGEVGWLAETADNAWGVMRPRIREGCFPGAEVFWIDSVPSPQPSAARPALKGEGASPCREKEWFQLETTGAAG
ncbi:hypothetical protein PCLA_21f0015 [Pseudomonas citronellolis]|nr:hypothetical protein PCLA_21f0015 [Pseudomonas citronellolis]